MFEKVGTVEIDLIAVSGVLDEIRQYAEAMLRELHAIESEATPQERVRREAVTPPIMLVQSAVFSIEQRKQLAIHSAFQNIVRSMIDFMDLILGIEILVSELHSVKSDIPGLDEFVSYLKNEIAEEAVKVGRKRNLANSKKVTKIGGLTPSMQSSLLGMIEARRIIEHHKCMIEHDFDFVTLQTRLLMDDILITEFPVPSREGQRISVEVVERIQAFKANQRLALSELDVDEAVLTLTQNIIPSQINSLSGRGWKSQKSAASGEEKRKDEDPDATD